VRLAVREHHADILDRHPALATYLAVS